MPWVSFRMVIDIDASLWTVAVAWISGSGSCLSNDSRIACHSDSEAGQFLTLSEDTRSCFTTREVRLKPESVRQCVPQIADRDLILRRD